MSDYDRQVTPREIDERGFPIGEDPQEQLKFLLRYAILAPSSHNTQPWHFAVTVDEIHICAV